MPWSDRIGRRFKLRDLHILLAVVQSGSMGKAAGQLAMSQPVVSKAVSDMEHALGVRLLDRSRRGVELTTYGRAVIKRGAAVFVCGNANTMAPGVRAALADIFRQHTGGTSAQAQDWLADLRADDRFLEDIWGG